MYIIECGRPQDRKIRRRQGCPTVNDPATFCAKMRGMELKVSLWPDRHAVVAIGFASAVLIGFAGCTTTGGNNTGSVTSSMFGFGATTEEPRGPDPAFARAVVTYPTPEPP